MQNYFSMFGYGGQAQEVESTSVGSGIIIGKNDTELLIVTNNHVVEGADTLSASFIDNSVYEATIKGTDSDNDLAVIAVPLSSISDDTMSQIAVAAVGDSDSLKVGEQVVAIGNALGYGQSVTTGIVSATDRTLSSSDSSDSNALISSTVTTKETPTYIQTDAAINPGNSGGALVNMKGEVIGINSAKLASTEVEGMGYAIPITRVSSIIEELMNETTRTKVADSQKSSIGIAGITVDSNINAAYGIPAGVYVASVTQGSGAEAAAKAHSLSCLTTAAFSDQLLLDSVLISHRFVSSVSSFCRSGLRVVGRLAFFRALCRGKGDGQLLFCISAALAGRLYRNRNRFSCCIVLQLLFQFLNGADGLAIEFCDDITLPRRGAVASATIYPCAECASPRSVFIS